MFELSLALPLGTTSTRALPSGVIQSRHEILGQRIPWRRVRASAALRICLRCASRLGQKSLPRFAKPPFWRDGGEVLKCRRDTQRQGRCLHPLPRASTKALLASVSAATVSSSLGCGLGSDGLERRPKQTCGIGDDRQLLVLVLRHEALEA